MKKVSVWVLASLVLFSLFGLSAHAAPPMDGGGRAAVAEKPAGAEKPGVDFKVSGTPLYTHQSTSNTYHEMESAVTALEVNGTDYTVGAYMREVGMIFRINTISSTSLPPGLYSWTRKTPALPAGHEESVDPVLDVNPYVDGVSPETVYLGGLTYELDNSFRRIKPEAITVWSSTNGGVTWSSPTIVDSHTLSSQGSLDKPDLVVSWYTGTRGYVYVAYVKVKSAGNEIFVARSTDGGVSFGTPVKIATGPYQAPQVVVSSATGKVYVIWMDMTNDRFKMSSSDPFNFTTWTAQADLVLSGSILGPGETVPGDGLAPCPNGVQAVTVAQARYNWVKGHIGLVWHQKDASGRTNVYFSNFGASGWSTPSAINASSTSDQWMPALDFDETGDYLVVYWDRSQDPSNLKYREAWAKVTSTGTVVSSGYVSGAFDSDPTDVYGNGSICFKGEYQDVWYWPYSAGGRFHALWVGHPSSGNNDDVYISGIQ